MRRTALACVLFAIATTAACGDPGAGTGDDDVAPDAAAAPDAAPDGWETLIAADWTLPPGEGYFCMRKTVTEDVWVKAFHGTVPLGSHHSVLTIGDPTVADGLTPCDAGTNQPAMIYGNAVGTNDVVMPDGVAIKVPAGKQLLLNMHLYNTQPSMDLSGTSAVQVQRLPADQIASVTEAEIVLMGPVSFDIPTGDHDVVGGCTMTGDAHLFTVNPHMHRLGVHAKVVAKRAAGDVVMHDGAYAFDDQRFYPFDPIEVHQGDKVEITCSYHNDTGASVPFGDSTDEEMCFASTYRYPALGGSFGPVCPF